MCRTVTRRIVRTGTTSRKVTDGGLGDADTDSCDCELDRVLCGHRARGMVGLGLGLGLGTRQWRRVEVKGGARARRRSLPDDNRYSIRLSLSLSL